MKLRKISENIYEIPKEGYMKVAVKIFANEKLISSMKDDETFKQAVNVASLPGLVENVILCPDGHMGYGMPIGGVAGFDLKKGIVAPGMIGFDINCLHGDSKILTEFGAYKQIKEFGNYKQEIEFNSNGQKIKKICFNVNLPTLNLDKKISENKSINLFMEKESNELYKVELNSGMSLKLTSDHPLLTKKGMIPFCKISKKEKVAINTFEGIKDDKPINRKLAIAVKILGYLFGDGCVYKSGKRYYTSAYGSEEDLKLMKKDLESININSSIYSRKRNHRIPTRYKLVEFTTTNYELHIHSQDFIKFLVKLGMPLGNKTRQKVNLPCWIKKSRPLIKRLFLAGFFGAELSTPKANSKTCFYCAIIDQNKIESLRENMRNFLIDISLLLEEFKIKTTKISEMDDFKNRHNEKTKRFRLLISNEENLLKLWRNIGFEYNKKRKRLANIASLYILLKRQENKKRKRIAKKIKEYKAKGFTLKEVQRIFCGEINNRFIERHYYENVKQRISLSFISFDEFKETKLKEIEEHGCIFDGIKEIKKIDGIHKVYDFNMRDNHNFIANNFIVSNCGVRVLATDISKEEFMKKRKEIIHDIKRTIPSGVGRGGEKHSPEVIKEVLIKGSQWALENGFATKEDLERTEENGKMEGANPEDVSERAISRGVPQLGTLGAGNHFIDVQVVEEIFNENVAKVFGLKKGNIVIMIHCGSRGLGHQVASDYLRIVDEKYGHEGLPDRELVNAPIESEEGKKYLSAMKCSVNFAFCNRQIIMHKVRELIKRYYPDKKTNLVYDIAHNIGKIEEHLIEGSKKSKIFVVRKGATRSFGPGRKEIPEVYRKVGQPVLIPGSMSTSSFILVGTKEAEEKSFSSSAHGAGRAHSRAWTHRELKAEEVKKILAKKNIILEGSFKGTMEESELAYKDIDEVIGVTEKAGLSRKVAELKPIAVMIG